MAENVIINGITYQNVPEVDIPKVGGGTARFMDTGDATLSSGAQMLNGVTAYGNGVKVTGAIATKTSSDLTVSDDTVTAPAGYYASAVSKSVAAGEVVLPSMLFVTGATIEEVTNNRITLVGDDTGTPDVITPGYITAGTSSPCRLKLRATIATQAAQTYTPGTTAQTIAADQYLLGAQTIAGDANLVPQNIVAGVSIFGVAGSATLPTISQDSTTKVLSIS